MRGGPGSVGCTRTSFRFAPPGGARQRNQTLPLLGAADLTAGCNYIKEFVMARNREPGRPYGVEYAEAFHYIGPGASSANRDSRIDAYVRERAVPAK